MSDTLTAELERPPQGARPFEFRPTPDGPPRFVSGDRSGERIRARYFLRTSDQSLLGNVWFGPWAQGPPGHAHGGSIAALLDETMGSLCWVRGYWVLVANLNVDFKAPVPLNRVIRVDSTIERIEGRKIFTTGRVYDDDGTLYATGTGLCFDAKNMNKPGMMPKEDVQKIFFLDEA